MVLADGGDMTNLSILPDTIDTLRQFHSALQLDNDVSCAVRTAIDLCF